MPKFYPTIINSFHGSEGERLVYEALSKLNNEYVIFHSYKMCIRDRHIDNIIVNNLGFEIPIICTSIYNDDVFDVLNNIITNFDAQILYEKNMTSILQKNKNMIIDALELIKKHEVCDVDEIEIEIDVYKRQV